MTHDESRLTHACGRYYNSIFDCKFGLIHKIIKHVKVEIIHTEQILDFFVQCDAFKGVNRNVFRTLVLVKV